MNQNTCAGESRRSWGAADPATIEQLKLGCLQRIADATEVMAKRYSLLIEERDYWERRAKEERAAAERLRRSNAALRGAITRLKRKGGPEA
jgi:hypothetical protein